MRFHTTIVPEHGYLTVPTHRKAPWGLTAGALPALHGIVPAQSGRGQHIDVSAQQSTTLALLNRALDGLVGQTKAERSAYGTTVNGVHLQTQYQARDGWAVCLQGVLPPIAPFMQRLMEWVHAEGLCSAADLRWDPDKGGNPRFIVTSLSIEEFAARPLYEDLYCARGDVENRRAFRKDFSASGS